MTSIFVSLTSLFCVNIPESPFRDCTGGVYTCGVCGIDVVEEKEVAVAATDANVVVVADVVVYRIRRRYWKASSRIYCDRLGQKGVFPLLHSLVFFIFNIAFLCCRLPIIQGGTIAFLTPTIVFLSRAECIFTEVEEGIVYDKNELTF